MRKDLPQSDWYKSSYSSDGNGQCIETQTTPEGEIAVGDSKDRTQGAFAFSPEAWTSFVSGVKSGDFPLV